MCAVLFVRLAAKGKYTLMAIRLAHKVIYGTDMMEKVIKIERCIKHISSFTTIRNQKLKYQSIKNSIYRQQHSRIKRKNVGQLHQRAS